MRTSRSSRRAPPAIRYGAGDRARLASLLLARARATGRYEDLVSAEESARASLELRRGRNRGGALVLTNALMGQHRFREALAEAEQLEVEDSTDLTIASLTGEILLELGRYDDAARRFARIGTTTDNLAAQMRVVRWREITGDVDGAHRHASRCAGTRTARLRTVAGAARVVRAPGGGVRLPLWP